MANYAYIHTGIDRVTAFEMLRAVVEDLFGDKVLVREGEMEDFYGPTWVVYAPGTALPRSKAARVMVAPDEDFGFMVSLQRGGTLAFRRPFNLWASWAQGCVIEKMSDILGVPHVYDADDIEMQPGTDTNSCHKTFKAWLMRNLDSNDPQDVAYVARFEEVCPKGFW
jgi:hypothetical protein